MGTIGRRLKLLVRSKVTWTTSEAASRAAALGAALAAVPRDLLDLPGSIRESLLARRGDLSPEALYDLIPTGVKLKAEDVAEFLGKRDLSHIESIRNSPHRESEIANVIFERSEWNRARGSENMTGSELWLTRFDNFAEGVIQAAQATGAAVAQGAVVGALLELPVTMAENLILVRASALTEEQAIKRILSDVGKRAAAGAAGTAVFTGIAMVGLPVKAVAMPLAVVGGTLYVCSATDRIWRARGQLRVVLGTS